jgi:glucose-1-phosphate cytidylyltransferase
MGRRTESLQTVILAGGLGTRMGMQTSMRPKALVPIGGRPLIEHVMDVYRRFGHHDFIIGTGHMHEMVHAHFAQASVSQGASGPQHVQCIFTGTETQTAGRLKRLRPYLKGKTFLLTWTDSVGDIDLDQLVDFHRGHARLATLTAVRPPPRFGHVTIRPSGQVAFFEEKPENREGWINGAFFVLETRLLDRIAGDSDQFERDVLAELAAEGELMAFRHAGMWRCADTPADIAALEVALRQPALGDA